MCGEHIQHVGYNSEMSMRKMHEP